MAVGSIFHPSISINNHTFRGEYEDPNDLFKTICSVLKSKPAICSQVNIQTGHLQDEKLGPDILAAVSNYRDYDNQLAGMEKRANKAEIVIALMIVIMFNCFVIAYCKMYNKKKTADRMQIEVNNSVS